MLVLLALGCESPTRDAPEPEPELAPIAAGTTIEGRLSPGAAAEYALVLPDSQFRILFMATSGSVADTLVAELVSTRGGASGRVQSVGTDTVLAEQASTWLPPGGGGGPWRVRVRGMSANDGGPYRLRLFVPNVGPETAPAALILNEPITGEALDVVGDTDEFTVQGTAGEEWILFAQSLSASGAWIEARITEEATGEVLTDLRVGATEGLEVQSTGRTVVPRTGTYRVRVAADPRGDPHRARYGLRVDNVNRAPESRSASIAIGEVVAEAIGSVGDIDEFTFTGTAGQQVNVLAQLLEGMSDGLHVQLLRGEENVGYSVQLRQPTASLDDAAAGRVTLPETGVYTVRAMGHTFGTLAGATGRYRLEVYPVDPAPEAAGELRLDGPAVAGAIDRPGDIDEFAFPGDSGQLVVLHGSSEAEERQVGVQIRDALGALVAGALLGGEPRYIRVALPASGTYTVRVGSLEPLYGGMGAYELGAYPVDPAPEHVPATIALGQVVTGERIDRIGDLDVFTFRGLAGVEGNVFLGSTGSSPPPAFVTTPSIAYVVARAGTMSLDAASSGRFMMYDTVYTLSMDPRNSGTELSPFVGAYAFRVFPINPRPERAAAAYVLGDTVSDEILHPSGDVDEYTFTVHTQRTVHTFWTAPQRSGHSTTAVLRRQGAEVPVWSVGPGGNPSDYRFTLAPGTYHLKIFNSVITAFNGTPHSGPARLTYQFAFIPDP